MVDPCFWELFRRRGATSFAAVPYTFELLERVGFADMDLPSLRYVTQAGGRLAPESVRKYAELGRRSGWEFFVMYGQTEATARMAYLPPELAADVPGAVGIPVPGGSFRIDPVPGLEHGELVYSGPNVMLGYAECPEDLAAGRTVTELRTGDLARLHPAGVYEVVGRRSRFVKIVGLRVDLGQVERLLADLGVQAASAGTDDGVVVAVEGDHDAHLLGKVLAQGMGLPRAALEVHAVERLPRLATGKLDYQAVLALRGPKPGPAPARRQRWFGRAGQCPEDLPGRAGVRRHRGQRHVRVPGRGLTVLRGRVGAAGTGPGPSPAGLARDSGPGPGAAAPHGTGPEAPTVLCAGRNEHRAAGRGDRPDCQHARRPVQLAGCGPRAHGGGRLQLRTLPALRETGPAAAAATVQRGKNRGAQHGVHRGGVPDHRQLRARQYRAAQRHPRAGER